MGYNIAYRLHGPVAWKLCIETSRVTEKRGNVRTLGVLLFASILCLVSGCGGGSSSSGGSNLPPPPPSTPPALNGNWEIQAVSQVTANTSYLMSGSLSTTGTSVSGMLHYLSYSCFIGNGDTSLDIPVSGKISSAGALSLTSSAVASQTFTLAGTMSGGQITSGTYSVSGGCGNGEHGTITGFPVPSFTGTYTGGIVSDGVSWGTMTLNITQAATPDSNGLYDLSGTATVVNSGLWIWADNPANFVQATAWGGFVEGTVLTGNGAMSFNGTITDATGDTINCNFDVTGGSLDPGSGTFTLTRSK